jgi:cell division protein FtsI/penicillin-binding protein 2
MIVFVLVAVFYLLLAVRLVYLQAFRHAYFLKEADAYRVSKSLLPAQRGLILDRSGDPLAINVPATTVYADPAEVKDVPATAARLSSLLGIDDSKLQGMLLARSPKDHYRLLARRVTIAVGHAVKKADLLGIATVPDTKRDYPNGSLAAQVLGFTNSDGIGIEGVEHSQDALLEGTDGRIVGEVDREGRFLPGTMRHQVEPVNGHDLVLTIDKQLQNDADVALAKAVKEHHARNGVVVILDPHTGEILALSNQPSYNPNAPRPKRRLSTAAGLACEELWRDRAISDLYEPGSTLKSITASAVLQDQGPQMMDVYVPCTGHLQVGNHVIHEAPDALTAHLGNQNLRGILRVSSNVGMAQFGLGLGADKLYDFERKFGFLDKPGSGLPGEQCSFLQSPHTFNRFTGSVGWSKIQLANIAFGQGISITPLQLAAAYAAIANGGTLMRPHILHAIYTDGKETLIQPEPIRRVISPETAALVRSMLGTVVQDGTGKSAEIAGFAVGGKTGSAQYAGAHGYEPGHFVASFVSMVPLSHPRLVILCAVFLPQGMHWGAAVAAPVVHDLEKDAMLEMHVPPDDPGAIDWDDHLKHDARDLQRIAQLKQ